MYILLADGFGGSHFVGSSTFPRIRPLGNIFLNRIFGLKNFFPPPGQFQFYALAAGHYRKKNIKPCAYKRIRQYFFDWDLIPQPHRAIIIARCIAKNYNEKQCRSHGFERLTPVPGRKPHNHGSEFVNLTKQLLYFVICHLSGVMDSHCEYKRIWEEQTEGRGWL